MLEILTFTGVDVDTKLNDLTDIATQYPRVEFGILIGSQTGTGNPIFPPFDTVHTLRQLPINSSLHLCGTYARQATRLSQLSAPLTELCQGFNRIQVNLHKEAWDEDDIAVNPKALVEFAQSVTADSIILQHRGALSDIPLRHPKVEYLFDLSEGRGQESFHLWPTPPTGIRTGYAGGIGPQNIHRAMDFVHRHAYARLWLDMERNVRDHNYLLDLHRVQEVCEIALGPSR